MITGPPPKFHGTRDILGSDPVSETKRHDIDVDGRHSRGRPRPQNAQRERTDASTWVDHMRGLRQNRARDINHVADD